MNATSNTSPPIICIGGGANQSPLITEALDQGYPLIVVDQSSIKHPRRDEFFHLKKSTWDFDPIVQALEELGVHSIAAVLSRNSGPATFTAARLAQNFGVDGIPLSFAHASLSKSVLRDQLSALSLPIIEGEKSSTLPSEITAPIVIKPDQPISGKKNVYVIEHKDRTLFQACLTESINSQVDISTWLDGLDITVLLVIDRLHMQSFVFEELVGVANNKIYGIGIRWPSPINASKIESTLIKQSKCMALHWGIASGHYFFTYRVDGRGQCHLYEVNAGLSGDAIVEDLLKNTARSYNAYKTDVDLANHRLAEKLNPEGSRAVYIDTDSAHIAVCRDEYNARMKKTLQSLNLDIQHWILP